MTKYADMRSFILREARKDAEPGEKFRALIGAALDKHMRQVYGQMENDALACAIALAATDGEHGVSSPRAIERVITAGRPMTEDRFRIV